MNNDRCPCELVTLYALDLLDESDRQTFEAYQAECPELAEELAEYEEAVAAIPYSTPAVPMAANLKDRLFQRIEADSLQADDREINSSPSKDGAEQEKPAQPPLSPSLPQQIRQITRLLTRQLSPKNRIVVRQQDLVWEPHKVPGVTVAPLHVDLVKQEVVALLRAEAGVHYPLHRHAIAEEIYMLEGDLIIDGESYGAGDYIRSKPGSTHHPSTVGGCMFLVRTSLSDEYLR